MQEDKIYIELSDKNSAIEGIETPPSKRQLGGTPDIATDKIRLYIGSKPIAFNLKTLYETLGKELPPEIQIFKSYNAYIINHTIGVIREGGIDNIKQIGYRVRFSSETDIIVLDVMPQAKYIKNIGGDFNFEADLNLNGELSVPDELTEFLKENVQYVGVGGKLKAATDNKVVGRFSFSVQTPEIQSIGKGNNYSEWCFNKSDTPLYGNDIEMYQIVLVDRFADDLTFEANVYTTLSLWNMIPSRRESKWVEISCELS
jgi:hypothetical protein